MVTFNTCDICGKPIDRIEYHFSIAKEDRHYKSYYVCSEECLLDALQNEKLTLPFENRKRSYKKTPWRNINPWYIATVAGLLNLIYQIIHDFI